MASRARAFPFACVMRLAAAVLLRLGGYVRDSADCSKPLCPRTVPFRVRGTLLSLLARATAVRV